MIPVAEMRVAADCFRVAVDSDCVVVATLVATLAVIPVAVATLLLQRLLAIPDAEMLAIHAAEAISLVV